jgi:serine phosphatase RsbU (regulator of sigma subunit)
MIKSGDDTGINELIPIFSNATLTAYKFIYAFAFVYPIILQILIIFQLPVTEVIEKKTSEVQSLQNLSQMISKVLDIEELVSIIIQTIERITSSRDVFICLIDEKSNCKFYSNISESKNLFDRLSQLLTSKLNQTNEKILEIDVNEFYSEENHQIEKLIIIPLVYNKKLIGYILIGKDRASILDEDDLNTLKSIGEYSAIAIQNHHLLQKSIEKERLEKELEVAREVQKKLIPDKTPSIKNLDIAFSFIPAFEVGGDYIDYFQLDEENFGFIVADVSGKGISAAFYMAEVKGIFESLSKILTNPKDILIQANKILCKSLDRKSFVSVVYATINSKTGEIKIARAGHCPVLFLRNSEVIELLPSGIAIGLDHSQLFENNLEEISLQLQTNDLLVFYTDGVTEARNQQLEEFGTERLNEIVKQSMNNSSQAVIQKIFEELTVFSKDYPQHDDITLLAIKYLGE